MNRTVYVNGEYLAEADAKISVFDRGFLFADAVYEVSSILNGRMIDNAAHLARMHRSLGELSMAPPATDDEIVAAQNQLIARNNVDRGLIYLQVSRGAADREFHFPEGVSSSLVMFTQEKDILSNPKAEKGMSVITTPDIRWVRRDIKTVGLLAPCLAKQAAMEAGADDAWMVEGGYVTEGSSNNAYIVTADGTVITRQIGTEILKGITRTAILRLAEEDNVTVEERAFTPDEAYAAQEAFISSASAFVVPVVKIDGRSIGSGAPGPVVTRFRQLYIDAAEAETRGA